MLELVGATKTMEDLTRRCCGGRDAQGNTHTLRCGSRTRSLEVVLSDDVEQHVQLGRARGQARQGQRQMGARTARQKQGQGKQGLVECFFREVRSLLEGLLEQEGPDQLRWFEGEDKQNNETDAHNLDSAKPAKVEAEVHIGGFDLSC